MRIAIAATLAASLVAGPAHAQDNRTFDSAAEAASNLDFAKARQLYAVAAAEDADPKQRAQAALRLTNIEWRIFHDTAAAEKAAALIPENSEEFANGWAQRARMAAELKEDYATAAAHAQRAIAVATRDIDRLRHPRPRPSHH